MKNLTNGEITTYCNNIRLYGIDALEGISKMNAREILKHITIQRDQYVMNAVQVGAANPVGQYNYPKSVVDGQEWKHWLNTNTSFQHATYIRYVLLLYLHPTGLEINESIKSNKFNVNEAHELLNSIVNGEITVRRVLVFKGAEPSNAVISYRTQASNIKFDNLSVNNSADIYINGFPIYVHNKEQSRKLALDIFDKVAPSETVTDLFRDYLNKRIEAIKRKNSIVNSHRLTNDLEWLIEQEKNTLKVILEHIGLFYDDSPERDTFIKMCKGFLLWLERQNKTNNIKSFESIFPSTNELDLLLQSLSDKQLIDPNNYAWIDQAKGSKSCLIAVLKSLKRKGYLKPSAKLTNNQIKDICTTYFRLEVSIDTVKRTKHDSHDLSWLPYMQ